MATKAFLRAEKGPVQDDAAGLLRRVGANATVRVAEQAEFAPAVPGRLETGRLQVGAAGDPAEADADRRADRALAVLGAGVVEPPASATAAAPARRRAAVVGAAGGALDADVSREVEAARGGGTPLPGLLRTSMEGALGADLTGVRVHTGTRAAALNDAMSAKAFTTGNDVFFRDGMPDTATPTGAHLLAHELAHTLQQGGGAHRQVRRVLDPGNLDWTSVESIRPVPVGMMNKGLLVLNDGGGSEVVVKFVNEKVGAAPFGDKVAGTVGLANPETTPLDTSQVASTIASVQSVLTRMKANGQGAEATAVEDHLRNKGTAKNSTGVLVMKRVPGVDLGQHTVAASASASFTDDVKQEAMAQGGKADFDVVGLFSRGSFLSQLGRVAVADALMGNQDRLSLDMQKSAATKRGPAKTTVYGTFNMANFKVFGKGLVGTFDQDTRLYGYDVVSSHTKDVNPRAWTELLITGEAFSSKIGERVMPSLGLIFTPAGQQELYDTIVKKLSPDLDDANKARLAKQFPLERFKRYFNIGLRDGLLQIVANADELRRAAKTVGGDDQAGGDLGSDALEVKLAYLEAKAGAIGGGKRSGPLATSLADNAGAEDAAHKTGIATLLVSGQLFRMPTLPAAPQNPANLGLLSAAGRGIARKGRDASGEEAQTLRNEAQEATPSAAFFQKLDENADRLAAVTNPDRRVQSALFHLRLHQLTRDVTTVHAGIYNDAANVVADPSGVPVTLRNKLTRTDLTGQAKDLTNGITRLTNDYLGQLRGSADKEQLARMRLAHQVVRDPMMSIIAVYARKAQSGLAQTG